MDFCRFGKEIATNGSLSLSKKNLKFSDFFADYVKFIKVFVLEVSEIRLTFKMTLKYLSNVEKCRKNIFLIKNLPKFTKNSLDSQITVTFSIKLTSN